MKHQSGPGGRHGMTETEFMSQVLHLARLRGWRVAHFRPARMANGWHTAVSGDGKGFPDLLLVRVGRILVAELKVGRRKPTAEQAAWLAAFEEADVPAYLWTPADWQQIAEVLR